MTYDFYKRLVDVVLAGIGLVITAPLQMVIAVIIWRKLGRPVLFRQQRPGRDGEVFELVKFRSMLRVDTEKGLVSDKDRLTRFGQLLRSTSLDELPTLVNVLKGDMSLVGPRPLLVQYLDHYTSEQMRRHDVRPGVTGLAQVAGRNSLSWDEKFALDIEYVNHRGPLLDLKIILRTIRSVILRQGISAPGDATMPAFIGSRGSESDVDV